MGITRIDNIGIAVRDAAAAAEFFEQKLGFKVELDASGEPPSATVHVGDQYLYVFQTTSDAAGERRSAGLVENPRGIDHVSFTVEDVDATYAELKGRGVAFDGEPATDEAWGIRMVGFNDPEGNSFFLVQSV